MSWYMIAGRHGMVGSWKVHIKDDQGLQEAIAIMLPYE